MPKETIPQAVEFGKVFGEIGLEHYRSKSAMARGLGISRETVSKIINGKSIVSAETFGDLLSEIEPSDCQIEVILPPFIRLLQEGLVPDNNRTFSPVMRKRISERLTGSHHDPATKEKIRNANIGKRHSPESIEKMRLKKQNMSDETRKKMSISRKRYLERMRRKKEVVLNGNMPHVVLPPELTPSEVI